MRRVSLDNAKTLCDAEDGLPILCWNNRGDACVARCGAFSKLMLQGPNGQELVAVCAAVPQQMPMGTFGAPTGIVVPNVKPLVTGR